MCLRKGSRKLKFLKTLKKLLQLGVVRFFFIIANFLCTGCPKTAVRGGNTKYFSKITSEMISTHPFHFDNQHSICEIFIFLHFVCRGVPGGPKTLFLYLNKRARHYTNHIQHLAFTYFRLIRRNYPFLPHLEIDQEYWWDDGCWFHGLCSFGPLGCLHC